MIKTIHHTQNLKRSGEASVTPGLSSGSHPSGRRNRRWCWLRCWGAAPGRASALAPPGARTLAPGPLRLGCWQAPRGDGAETLHSCHLLPHGLRGAICHLTPSVMLCAGFSALSFGLQTLCGQNHVFSLCLQPVLSIMPYILVSTNCWMICLKWQYGIGSENEAWFLMVLNNMPHVFI